MATFRQICEAIGRDFWDNKKSQELDDNAMRVIKRGLEIRAERSDGKTFWDDFMNVLGNNSEGASSLLEVSPDMIAKWSTKIRKALDKSHEDNEGDMIKTGESGN